MRNFSIKRFTASLLLIVMLVAAVPSTMFNFAIKASAAEGESSTIIDAAIFFSDLHTNKNDYKESTLKGVLNSIKNNHSGVTFTSITSGGDAFSVNEDNSSDNGPYTGKTATLNGYIKAVFTEGIDINYVWSDHDRCAVLEDGKTLLDKTSHLSYGAGGDGKYGTEDDGNYYVYTLSMGDLCSYDRYSAGFNYTLTSNNRVANGFTETVPLAIQQFKDDVAKLHKDRPLFIVSHQPLFNNRRDNAWAEDWCNAINEVAESMDVAFFYGHNHKYDSGSDYYYAKGSTMAVATRKLSNGNDWNYNYQVGSGWQYNNTLASVNKVINFTHMCTGYLAPSSTGSTSSTTREGTALAVTITADSINYVTYSASSKYTGSYAADYTVKRDHAVVTPVVPDATYEDNSGLGISVTAPGITGVNASVVSTVKPEGYSAYIAYDIQPSGYTQGKEATVVAPVDSTFNPGKPVIVIDGNEIIDTVNIVDGTVTFKTNHFSTYALAQLSLKTEGGNWVTITEPVAGGIKYVLDTNGVNTNTKYLIVNTSSDGKAYVLTNNNGTPGRTEVKINDGEIIVENDTNINWIFSDSTSGTIVNQNRYVYPNDGSLSFQDSGSNMTISNQNNGAYRIYRTASYYYYYLRYYNNAWTGARVGTWNGTSSISSVYLFAYDGTGEDTSGTYAMIDGNLSYTLDRGTSAEDALAAVMAGITGYKYLGQSAPEDGVLTGATAMDDSELGWELEAAYGNGATPGEYSVTIKHNSSGKTLGVAVVKVPEVKITGYELIQFTGEVNRGVGASAHTGAMIEITYEDGSTSKVPVTVAMLTDANGNAVSTETVNEEGIGNLTVTYNGEILTDEANSFTLIVLPKEGNNYPEFPNEGSVKVNKTAIYKDEDFRKFGVAQVELSVEGIAMNKGVDVIVMLDLSSSMDRCISCGNYTGKYSSKSDSCNCTNAKTRVDEMRTALEALQASLQASNNASNIKIAIADFNGMYTTGASAYDSADRTVDVGGLSADVTSNSIFTGSKTLDAGAFVSAVDLDVSKFSFNDGIAKTGTNYDYAFDAIYQLGYSIKQENETNHPDDDRELFVIFMSDGAANQFNYYVTSGGQSVDAQNPVGSQDWDAWLTGNVGEGKDFTFAEIIKNTAHSYYYDSATDNQHRMANAIKGDTDKLYEVIRKNQGIYTGDGKSGVDDVTELLQPTGKDNLYMIPGLGATTYTVAFYVSNDGRISGESAKHSLKATATSEEHYVDASTEGALAEAFSKIGGQIAYAANNACFVDQMGDTFDIQMSSSVTRKVDGKNLVLPVTPTIEVKTYDIWTRNEYLAGKCEEDMIGTRKTDVNGKFLYTLLEKITFNADGTEAYSSELGSGSILNKDKKDNVIYAKTFFYNNNKDGTSVQIDTNGDGVNDYSLAPETFYWKVGTVMEKELAISYYVYLTDTLAGERAPGSYATNNFAILYYDNYLGNPCELHTVSPMLAWKEANVSYAFYLVNEKGQVVVNRTTGETGTFANKIAVTRPVVFDTCKLNTETELPVLEIVQEKDDILPEGYKIYDEKAAYKIVVLSDTEDMDIGWVIQKSDNLAHSTYVTGFSSSVQYSNATENHSTGYDYTHTTVWFAVVWTPSTIPDQVVIDYGLPVDISVLENDLFPMDKVRVNGVGRLTDKPQIQEGWKYTTNAAFTDNKSLTLTYGKAELSGTTKVRYTPTSMSMNTYEKFLYEVRYLTTSGEYQYYYGDVTVIPATNIYYEENFVTFVDANPNNGAYGVWDNEGTAVAGVQDEDRPGKDSLGTIDHDNVYGYDAAYTSYKKFSLGTAKWVSVNSEVGNHRDNSPTAEFTFTGTGFDIISMTNSDSGVIFISVYETGTENAVSNKFVDNYYGYTYDETNGWTPTPSDAAIYQVPVMKFAGLPYGTYDVVIWVTYGDYFDHDTASANGTPGYSFWLDSIRIYDPANGGKGDNDTVIEDAYGKDNESNPSYLEIGDAILPSKTEIDEGAKLPGVVFIDGNKKLDDGTPGTNIPDDYAGPGPNNEVYLLPGHVISFKLSSNATPLDVQIGVKLAFGDTADVQFTYSANDKSESRTRTLTTATDMYYSIASYLHFVPDNQQSETGVAWTSGTITLMNVSGSVISLTNIKATFKMASYGGNAADINGTPAKISFVTDTEVIENAAAVVTKFFASKPKPVLEVFDPETLAYTVVSGIRGINTVRVITSNDADAITVNGIEATKTDDSKIIKSMVKMLDKLYGDKHNADDYCVWTVEVKSAPVYDIVAFQIVEIPDPSIDASAVFEPETVAHTVISNINGTNTVRVITSKDVSSIIVNGVKAEKINDAKILKSMVKMLDKLYDDKHNESDYYVWTVDVKSAASYDIVAFNEDGVSTIPAIENTKNVSNK